MLKYQWKAVQNIDLNGLMFYNHKSKVLTWTYEKGSINTWKKMHMIKYIGYCKKDITPLLTHWSYIFLVLTHRNVFGTDFEYSTHMGLQWVVLFFFMSEWTTLPCGRCKWHMLNYYCIQVFVYSKVMTNVEHKTNFEVFYFFYHSETHITCIDNL